MSQRGQARLHNLELTRHTLVFLAGKAFKGENLDKLPSLSGGEGGIAPAGCLMTTMASQIRRHCRRVRN